MVTSLALHWLLFAMLNITFHSFRHAQKAKLFQDRFWVYNDTGLLTFIFCCFSFMLLLLFLPLFSFAGHLLSFISVGEVFGKVSCSQSQKTVNTWNIFSVMLWPVMHCPAPSLPYHPKFPRQLHVISQGKVMHNYLDNRHLDVTMYSMVIPFTKKLCYIVYRVCTEAWILEKKSWN